MVVSSSHLDWAHLRGVVRLWLTREESRDESRRGVCTGPSTLNRQGAAEARLEQVHPSASALCALASRRGVRQTGRSVLISEKRSLTQKLRRRRMNSRPSGPRG